MLVHPLDPLTAAETVADVLRRAQADAATRPALASAADAVADTSRTAWRRPGRACSAGCSRASDLGADDTAWVMDRVLSGEATAAQLAGFLVALRAKGETADEVAGLAAAMLRHARRVTVPGPAVDVVGTGGDQARTVNISTMAAVVVAAAGRAGGQARQPGRVVGQRGRRRAGGARRGDRPAARRGGARASPRPASGSASRRCSTRRCGTPGRSARELGVPTAMNVLGPLTNPAQPPRRAGRLRRPAAGAGDGRGVRGPRRVGAGGARRRRARRADHHDHQHACGWSAAGRCGSEIARPGGARRGRGDPRGPARRRRRRATPRCSGRVLAGERGPVRDAVLLNAAGRAGGVRRGGGRGRRADLAAPSRRALDAGGGRRSTRGGGALLDALGGAVRRRLRGADLARVTAGAAGQVRGRRRTPPRCRPGCSERNAMWVSVRRTPVDLAEPPGDHVGQLLVLGRPSPSR